MVEMHNGYVDTSQETYPSELEGGCRRYNGKNKCFPIYKPCDQEKIPNLS